MPIGSIPVELTDDERSEVTKKFADLHRIEMLAEWPQEDPPDLLAKWVNLEEEFAAYIDTDLQQRAEFLRDMWMTRYPRTGRRNSVLGGEDYDVVIEDNFARPFPEEMPYYE